MSGSSNPQSIENIRHSLAHLLAAAVLEKFPDAKLAIGPTIDSGFYYDFLLPSGLTPEDLKGFEKKMRSLVNKGLPFSGEKVSTAEAKKLFSDQPFKLELIDEFSGENKDLTVYRTGDVFMDLCRGGHVDNTSEIPADAFKLDKIAGAYWRGDEKNAMLTRIYGLAFASKEELNAYTLQREEAKKRDHRKLGQELDLFVISDLVGAGLPLFTPKGTILRDQIADFLWALNKEQGYEKVDIPHLAKPELYKVSGHWDKYKDDGFQVHGRDKHFMLKPMNCPHHTQIYSSRARSYRELPIRYFDVTKVYRDEQSGELMGLSRVLSITQDDGHVFCRPDQIGEEVARIVSIIKDFYTVFGMFKEGSYWARLSVRDPKTPEKYLGDPAVWDTAEERLEDIGREHGISLTRGEGEAAFYGPKLDFMFKDAIGREWQLATIQLDFVQPERFELEYTDDKGDKVRPVMIHRAISGSLERFLSVMIEHYAGAFPLWLAPTQARVLPVSEKYTEYAKKVMTALRGKDVRAELDESNESLGKRIRESEIAKVQYVAVVGEKESSDGTVAVRNRKDGSQVVMKLDEFIKKLEQEIEGKIS